MCVELGLLGMKMKQTEAFVSYTQKGTTIQLFASSHFTFFFRSALLFRSRGAPQSFNRCGFRRAAVTVTRHAFCRLCIREMRIECVRLNGRACLSRTWIARRRPHIWHLGLHYPLHYPQCIEPCGPIEPSPRLAIRMHHPLASNRIPSGSLSPPARQPRCVCLIHLCSKPGA